MKRILFVDDEPNVLAGLRRMLYPLRQEWSMVFAGSGREALAHLSESPFDVLITDMHMPEMSGVDLLSKVLEQYPQVVRLVLSGTADREFTLRSVTLAHQYLCKPCDAQTLRATVNRAFALRELLEDPWLKRVISGTAKLPSVPAVYTRLSEAVESPDVEVKQVAAIIAEDMAMTAKLLQLVNSAFFGVQRRITDLADAVALLGMETVRDLVLAFAIFSQFDGSPVVKASIQRLSEHSLAVAKLARAIAKSFRLAQPAARDAFVAGLLHDVGKLVLIANCNGEWNRAVEIAGQKSIPGRDAEREVFGTTHSEVGTYLAWLWGLPDAINHVVAYHHCPGKAPVETMRLVLAVHLADALAHHKGAAEIDRACLERLGLADEWNAMLETVD